MSLLQPEFPTDMDVSRETSEALHCYAELLAKWTKTINLVSKKSLDDLWQRHIVDSIQVYFAMAPTNFGHWVDLGSGGGLPGVVVAILSKEFTPGVSVTCVESDRRKATFLRTVSRETHCQFNVLDARIEAIKPLKADFLSARALAPLSNLLDFAYIHMNGEGCAVFPKGAKFNTEIVEARKLWKFSHQEIPSVTDPHAVLLKIRDITRV